MKLDSILNKVKNLLSKPKPVVEEAKVEVPVETKTVVEEKTTTKAPAKKVSKKVTSKTK